MNRTQVIRWLKMLKLQRIVDKEPIVKLIRNLIDEL